MTKDYLSRMAAAFPLWLEKNSQLDEISIKEAHEYVSLFISYVNAKGVDLELKEL